MDKLNNLLEINFQEYKENLLKNNQEYIFNHSYETAIKYEIVHYIDYTNLNEITINKLIHMKNPLEFLYQEYLKADNVNIVNELKILFENL